MSDAPVVLITGASRGIGGDLAAALLASGYRVAASMRGTGARNAEAAGRLRGLGAFVTDIDVTDEASVDRGVAATVDEFGVIDVLVNNAGYGIFGALESATPADLARQLDINVVGVQRVMRAALPAMRAQRRGLVLQFSSGLGRFVMPARGPYSISKWALEAMSDTYRIELAQFGIDVVVLELGPFRSSFQDEHGTGSDGARELQYPQFNGGVQRSENAHRQGWGRFADTGVLVKAVDELITQPAGTRPWRVALHPLRELLDPYNAHLEELERTVLTSRGDTAFLPPGG
jgi:NAD(P)-dependent dehydrogenase (short-subunit alcohol dehydrogenase family)